MTARRQALMIGHGTLVLVLGLLVGFVFLFNLIGEVTLWPIPGTLHVAIPGDPARWRAAHLGNLTNGLMAIALGLCLPRVRLSPGAEGFVTWSVIAAIWGNAGFYLLSALGAAGRGLTFGPNRFGGGDVLSILAFLAGYPGAFVLPVAVLLVARGAFAAARDGEAPPR